MDGVLITGGSGFVGGALLEKLNSKSLVALGRSKPKGLRGRFFKSNIDSESEYSGCFQDIRVVIHCAARVHVMNEESSDPLASFREVNTAGTLKLAQCAADAGVKRFIFLSSIKVNGESTRNGSLYRSADQPAPVDPYGVSKAEAEAGLLDISNATGLEVVIIRPVLIYGPGVKGNFLNLLKVSHSGFPLPFGAIHNTRSMLYIENLIDFISICINHSKAANKIFLVSDADDISLSELIRIIRGVMGKPALLLSVPSVLFRVLGFLTRKTSVIERLVGDLQVDSREVMQCLDWKPPCSTKYGIKVTVDDFLKRIKR